MNIIEQIDPLHTLRATRYVTPLREGGSLPAIVEAEDDGLYVLKFRGAGQGSKALIAELIGGEIARAIGLRVPDIVLMDLDPAIGRNEADYEIRQLIGASEGINLGLDYLPGSLAYDPVANGIAARELASRIVWLDAFIMNVDRTARNTNMLMWHKNLWLIDHGAALFFHHTWQDYMEKSKSPFVQIKDHVLLPLADNMDKVNEEMRGRLKESMLASIIDQIPDIWLEGKHFSSTEEYKSAYREFLMSRLHHSDIFITEAEDARAKLV